MKRLASAAALVLILGACGGQQSTAGSAAGSPAASVAAASTLKLASSLAVSPPSNATKQPVQVYFTAAGKLAPETGQVATDSPARGVVELLLQGPKEPSHFSEIPKATQLQDVSIRDTVATVSFSGDFFGSGGAAGTELRLAQVVYSLTQLSGVSAVQFMDQGKPAPIFGEGLSLARPMSRQSFNNLQA